MRGRHGGRRSHVRCTTKVADFFLLAAAVNPARLGVLGPCQATGPDVTLSVRSVNRDPNRRSIMPAAAAADSAGRYSPW